MLAKQLAEIVENDQLDEIVPFLQKLGDKKKEIIPFLKKLHKEYSQYIQEVRSDGGISMSPLAKGDQLLILSIAAFVCCDEKSFSSMYGAFTLSKPVMDKILPWYCPSWFSSFVNKYAQADYIPFNYELYLEWIESKYVQESDELIAKLLPSYIFQSSSEKFKHIYAPQNLLKYPVTLSHHIWKIFQYENFIHGSDRYMSFSDGSKEGRWIKTFQELTEKEHLDRKHVLRETLLATNRNFNQALSGWFSQLFIELKPDLEELNDLRSELLGSLNSNSSKQVNTTLKLLKSMIARGSCLDNLKDYLNITINSNIKSIVLGTLACIEEMAKRETVDKGDLCHLASSALVNTDEAVQLRAAKFIKKYGGGSYKSLSQTISAFGDSLFIDSKSVLSSFLKEEKSDLLIELKYQEESNENTTNNDFERLASVDTFEELLFLASQAFDNNESWHLEHLCNALLLLQEHIKGDNINKLAPALQQAFKVLRNSFRIGTGFLDHLLATFFLEYSATIIERFPSASTDLQKLFNKYLGEQSWKQTLGLLSQWQQQHNKSATYQPFKTLLLDVLNFLKQSVAVPLLCCPDFYPCRISVPTLVERLKKYQAKGIQPSITDFQIAVSRILITDAGELTRLAESQLTGEHKDILVYLDSETSCKPAVGRLKPVWLVASIQKSIKKNGNILSHLTALRTEYLTGNFTWNAHAEKRYLQVYDREQQKYIDGKEVVTDRELRINFPDKFKAQPSIKTLLNKFADDTSEGSIYDSLEISGWISVEAFDIKRLLYLTPDNPSPILSQVVSKCLNFSKCWEEPEKRVVSQALEALLEGATDHGEMGTLFIAACMLNSDKTIANYAAEIWVRGISAGAIDSEKLGETLGKLEQHEYGPLKRLTDLMLNTMFKLSTKHSLALETLIVSCIIEMADEPINNTKKLLDLYRELLLINKSKASHPALIEKLNQWKANTGLKKVVESILQ
ncbi:DUF6493 family protein [Desertivirga arenae]|uniref:DUF6493 family protein n=1 Tax=Desertivirga arenae TaxID=2810309 RepID=UPI001A95DE32|nr:DUF6493 family protein [Pedobacter sp. SYSU D00823]